MKQLPTTKHGPPPLKTLLDIGCDRGRIAHHAATYLRVRARV